MECRLVNVEKYKSRHKLSFHFPWKPEHLIVGNWAEATFQVISDAYLNGLLSGAVV